MRVLLVDDHPLFRQGLRALLEQNDLINVVGEAANGSEAVELTKKMTPDVVIMDISMPVYSGLEATRQIKECYPDIKVLILSRHSDNIYVDQALKAGASGYVHKDAAFDELLIALDAIKKDRPYLSPAVLQPVFNSYLQSTPAASAIATYNKLTVREKEVFNLLLKGDSRSQVAESLVISPKTVDRHRSNLLSKLKLRKEAEIIQFARLIGLNDTD